MNTQDQVPVQSILSWVDGSPQGRDYAPPGYVEIDRVTGNWWRKTTRQELNTGWVLMANSSGVGPGDYVEIRYGPGAPSIPGEDWAMFYVNILCNQLSFWSPLTMDWTLVDVMKGAGVFFPQTVAELRDIPSDCVLRYARTMGNASSYDNQGSEYGWDAENTENDNGMRIIKPNDRAVTDAGRWRQLTSS